MVSSALKSYPNITEKILHTGQHFDPNMSDVFFNQLLIPKPSFALGINSGKHGEMTGRMLIAIEEVLLDQRPDLVLVYGDTNSTLAGALAASKLNIPIAHVEAGLRSFDMGMPEEVNRILCDQVSEYLFCPTENAMKNLRVEGLMRADKKIYQSGDVMHDAIKFFSTQARKPKLQLPESFILSTFHRAENTDDIKKLKSIVSGLNTVNDDILSVVAPLHPRTKKYIEEYGLSTNFHILEPVGYLEMIWLLENSSLVLTDSGGLQKEAYYMEKPCVVLRENSEWIELLGTGTTILVGADEDKLVAGARKLLSRPFKPTTLQYGTGNSSQLIADILAKV